MAKNINKSAFDGATKLKLDIIGECFEEWLPVFNYNDFIKKVYVFDFFAGSGTDIENNSGSPLILLGKAKGKDRKYCLKVQKEIIFVFNESRQDKSIELKENVENFIAQCKIENNCENCVYNHRIENFDFKDIFSHNKIKSILTNNEFGKFVFLDQYGIKEINDDIFRQLISFPKTDFIFFISSSFINRFKEHPNITKYIDTSKIEFEDIKPNEIHRAIAKYFRDLIPTEKEYYLHHFSIKKKKKKGNYYGLIFGSNHTLGMEKFLKVCWKYDRFSGEANYNIDNNFVANSLFGGLGENIKKDTIKREIIKLILAGKIEDNISGLKYTMRNGCEPKLFTEIVNELEQNKKIERIGEVNKQSTNIHTAKQYQIKILNNGT